MKIHSSLPPSHTCITVFLRRCIQYLVKTLISTSEGKNSHHITTTQKPGVNRIKTIQEDSENAIRLWLCAIKVKILTTQGEN